MGGSSLFMHVAAILATIKAQVLFLCFPKFLPVYSFAASAHPLKTLRCLACLPLAVARWPSNTREFETAATASPIRVLGAMSRSKSLT
jgi:hypothetical protein